MARELEKDKLDKLPEQIKSVTTIEEIVSLVSIKKFQKKTHKDGDKAWWVRVKDDAFKKGIDFDTAMINEYVKEYK